MLVVIGISVIGWIVFISGFGTYIKLGFGLLSSTHVVTTVLHVVNVSNNSLLGSVPLEHFKLTITCKHALCLFRDVKTKN